MQKQICDLKKEEFQKPLAHSSQVIPAVGDKSPRNTSFVFPPAAAGENCKLFSTIFSQQFVKWWL